MFYLLYVGNTRNTYTTTIYYIIYVIMIKNTITFISSIVTRALLCDRVRKCIVHTQNKKIYIVYKIIIFRTTCIV